MPTEVMSSAQAVQEDDDTPDLAKANEIPFNYEMRIETDTLRPVVFTDDFMRFTLQKKGFLSHQSKLQIQLKTVDANAKTGNFFPPLNIGINSVIDRAVLKVGNRTLCETQEFARLQGYRSLFLTPENNREREYYLTARCISYQPEYSTGDVASKVSDTFAIDTGRNPKVAVNGVGGVDFSLLPCSIVDDEKDENFSSYSIYLGDLFDIFNGNNLPLYLIEDQVHIEISTNDAKSVRMCNDSAAQLDAEFPLDNQNGKNVLVYDTIYYDGETMEKYRRGKGSDLQFGYVDYRCTRRTGTAAQFATGFDQNIGGAGRMVDRVVCALENTTFGAGTQPEELLTNQYYSQGPNQPARKLKTNIRYNDRDKYATDLDNLSVIFRETGRAEGLGSEPHVPKAYYSPFQVPSISVATIQGNNQSVSFARRFCYNAFKIDRGERVNNQGITLTYTSDITGEEDSTLFVWTALKKIATIKNGYMDSYFV